MKLCEETPTMQFKYKEMLVVPEPKIAPSHKTLTIKA